MNDDDPISIILITSGSRGLKLLFRYPFSSCTVNKLESIPGRKVSIEESCLSTRNPYSLVSDDSTKDTSERVLLLQTGALYGFEDSILATMLAPKPILCEQNFELKIKAVKLGTFLIFDFVFLISYLLL